MAPTLMPKVFQNSTPFWALMPERMPCLISRISVTVSACSISPGVAARAGEHDARAGGR